MSYLVYKTTNTLSGKFYIGVHRAKNPDVHDSYLGSGKLLKQAIQKYGASNFIRETLFSFETEREAFDKEKEILTDELLQSIQCYNIGVGGLGGDKYRHLTDDDRTKIREKRKENNRINGPRIDSEETRKTKSEAAKLRIINSPHTIPNNKGRKHTGKQLVNLQKSGKLRKGKMTITNGNVEKCVAMDADIPEGWYRGRVNSYYEKTQNATHTEETKNAIRQKNLGSKTYNNGTVSKKFYPGDVVPDGWVLGLVKKTSSRVRKEAE